MNAMPLIKKASLIIYVLLMAILAIATILEPGWGTEQVTHLIYHSVPFCLLWGVLAIFTLWIICKLRMWKRMSVFMLHLSFIGILGGALITFLSGKQGSIYLREGASTFQYVERGTNLTQTMPFSIQLDTFMIECYPDTDTPSDYISRVSLHSLVDADSLQAEISMNQVLDWKGYRFYQSSYDEEGTGSWLSVNHDPWGTLVTYIGYVCLALSMMLMLWQRRNRMYGILIGVTLLVAFVLQWKMRHSLTAPVLVSPWFGIHIAFIVVAYVLLASICINGIVALFSTRLEGKLMRTSRMLLFPAVFFLGAGIFIGAVWANESWGRYWAWDPKEVWALITFMVYGLAFHTDSFPVFRRPRFFHIYVVLALFTVLMTYFGVNHWLGGLHSYN